MFAWKKEGGASLNTYVKRVCVSVYADTVRGLRENLYKATCIP